MVVYVLPVLTVAPVPEVRDSPTAVNDIYLPPTDNYAPVDERLSNTVY